MKLNPTPEELKLRLLDAWIAENVYGWEWLAKPNPFENGSLRKALFPPECDEWIRYNFDPAQWVKPPPDTIMYSDWDTCCSLIQEGKRVHHQERGVPRFTSEHSWTLTLLETCRAKCQAISDQELQWTVKIIGYDDAWTVYRCDQLGSCMNQADDPDFRLAVCWFAKNFYTSLMHPNTED